METDSIKLEKQNVQQTKGLSSRIGPYLLYTLCFSVVFFLIFFFYIKAGKSFIQYGDGYRQGYFWTIEFKNAVSDLLAGNGFDFWNWYAGLGRPAKMGYLADPFCWLASLFVPEHIELGYTIGIVAEMYCAGLAFIFAAKNFGAEKPVLVTGALGYVFSSWVLNTALIQGHFILNLVLFPLLVAGVDLIYKKKTPLLFVLIVAFYLIRLPYFAYMSAIAICIYILVRYFAYNEEFTLSGYAKNIGVFVCYGTIGILLSMVVFLSSFYSLSGASISSAVTDTGALFPASFYKNLIPSIIGTAPVWANYMYIGVSSVFILLFVVSLKRFSVRNTALLMSLILAVLLPFPFFNKLMNGMSYPTGRWYFILVFFLVIAACDTLQNSVFNKKSTLFAMLATAGVFCIVFVVQMMPEGLNPDTIFDTKTNVNCFAVMINILIAFFAILLLYKTKNNSFGIGNNTVTCILILTMIGTVLMWTPVETKNMRSFLKDGQIMYKLSRSAQRSGSKIEDSDFYRIDQVNGISVNRTLSKYANETLWWRTRSVYTYDSKLPNNLLHYNKLLGNNEDYVERVTLFSNDNRSGLDLMTGVKYFLGDDSVSGSITSDYSGYGFEEMQTIDGVEVQKNKYSIGLGTCFDSYITHSEYEKLSRLEREQCLLQAAVVADDQEDQYKGLTEKTAGDIDTDIDEIPITVSSYGNVDISDNKFKVKVNGAAMIIHPSRPVTGQMVLSFDNLLKKNDQGMQSAPFSIDCFTDTIQKRMMNKLGNQGIGGIVDYDVNLDYVEGYNGDIIVKFNKAGDYTYDRLYLSAMDMANYDRYAAERQACKYNMDEFNDDVIKGTSSCDSKSIMYFSIPADKGWSVFVDGEKKHVIRDLNYAFIGVLLPAGEHTVDLYYSNPGLKPGLLAVCAGLLLLIIALLIRRRFNKNCKGDIIGQ